jgi:SAM-dependent methyltransferase
VTALAYTPLEPLTVGRPVDRAGFILERCRDRLVLDLGCYDETALAKRDTGQWLHGAIAGVARGVLGVDSSERLPPDGLPTGPRSRIVRGDITALDRILGATEVEVVVAGELIEHLRDPLAFLEQLRRLLPGRELVVTTPNATALHNVLLGLASRESNHPDHLQVFSFKTLSTLCLRAGFQAWSIIPYHVYFAEMALRVSGAKRLGVRAAERAVNLAERMFPLLAGGLIVHVPKM